MKPMADKKSSLRRYVRILFAYMRLYLARRMAYRFDFVLNFILAVLFTSMSLLFVTFVYRNVPVVAGWTRDEALLIVASYSIVNGLAWMFCFGGFWNFDLLLSTGKFDSFLVKPAPPILLVAFYRTTLEDISEVLIGVVLIARYYVQHSELHVFPHVFGVALSLLYGFIIYTSVFVLAKCLSFKKIQSWSMNRLVTDMFAIGKYPQSIFRQTLLRFTTTVILPIAFIGTVPANFVKGEGTIAILLLGFVLTCIFLFLTRFVWQRSLRDYSSAS